ncbi:MAG: glycogen/starch/alpha-glucan family phosphorylase [Desulfobacterales bacterium]|nr:glycogen/starch/alpha-glucan family phosphorylase [Desulfobacterales bacterium]
MYLRQMDKLGNRKRDIQQSIYRHLKYSLGKSIEASTEKDIFYALSLTVRDHLIEAMNQTEKKFLKAPKRVYYLSIDYWLGRCLKKYLIQLGMVEECQKAFKEMDIDLEAVFEFETNAALGNGVSGRYTACFLDSLASLEIPSLSYGIFYEYGMFKQIIQHGYQVEKADNWRESTAPIYIKREDEACTVRLYGHVDHEFDVNGEYIPVWLGWKSVKGIPYDIPIMGYKGKIVNCLRLYSAASTPDFEMQILNIADYLTAVKHQIDVENISKILFPTGISDDYHELRLIQEYFLVACAINDIVSRYKKTHQDFSAFSDHIAIQLNDNQTALAVVEFMRVLLDEHHLTWEIAWQIVQKTISYTNHAITFESLEQWPVSIFEKILPRHMQLIYEMNHRFLQELSRQPSGDTNRIQRMSIFEEIPEKKIRMLHLAMIGSHSINGVSESHTDQLKRQIVPDFVKYWPDKFCNKTNGINHRFWIFNINSDLADLITKHIGRTWLLDLTKIRELEKYAENDAFRQAFQQVKQFCKKRLTNYIKTTLQKEIDPQTMFDVHAKPIHEHNRQLLKLMHIIHEYLCIIEDQKHPHIAKTFIFSGKASPGNWVAKQLIKLIHNISDIINNDHRANRFISVIFLSDFRLNVAEKIIPAADLSEQIALAGKETASTGNMKFALNGALTIGTPDGTNKEMLSEIGQENMYMFGLSAEELVKLQQTRAYKPIECYHKHLHIARILNTFRDDRFCPKEPGLFKWIYHYILDQGDVFYQLMDFQAYLKAYEKIEGDYQNQQLWNKKCILTISRMGRFSSDRTVQEYANQIWKIK